MISTLAGMKKLWGKCCCGSCKNVKLKLGIYLNMKHKIMVLTFSNQILLLNMKTCKITEKIRNIIEEEGEGISKGASRIWRY